MFSDSKKLLDFVKSFLYHPLSMGKEQIRMADAARELATSRQMVLHWINGGQIKHEMALGVQVVTRVGLDRFKRSITYLNYIAKKSARNGKSREKKR